MELARRTGFVPLRRGFSKPTYGLSSVTPALATEDEVASLLASTSERFRQYDVSRYIEQIAHRRVMTQAQIGTSVFTIDSIPTGSGVAASIVNEGFGINQLLYLLTICLYSPFKIVAIEEPEIHLHPSMVRELARAMVTIAADEDRRLIVSTHSEVFVTALLAQIAAGVKPPPTISRSSWRRTGMGRALSHRRRPRRTDRLREGSERSWRRRWETWRRFWESMIRGILCRP